MQTETALLSHVWRPADGRVTQRNNTRATILPCFSFCPFQKAAVCLTNAHKNTIKHIQLSLSDAFSITLCVCLAEQFRLTLFIKPLAGTKHSSFIRIEPEGNERRTNSCNFYQRAGWQGVFAFLAHTNAQYLWGMPDLSAQSSEISQESGTTYDVHKLSLRTLWQKGHAHKQRGLSVSASLWAFVSLTNAHIWITLACLKGFQSLWRRVKKRRRRYSWGNIFTHTQTEDSQTQLLTTPQIPCNHTFINNS